MRPKRITKRKTNGTHLHVNSGGGHYPRISAGPCRGKYVHRIVAEALLRRRLKPNETVDHKNQNTLDPDPTNLQVVSWADHAKITARRRDRRLDLAGFERGVDYNVVLDGGEVMEMEPGSE
jgi:hypothetical protein